MRAEKGIGSTEVETAGRNTLLWRPSVLLNHTVLYIPHITVHTSTFEMTLVARLFSIEPEKVPRMFCKCA